MDPISTLCLAALVFLSLPLPLFASAAISTLPSAKRSLLPWVWANAMGGAAAGVVIVTTPLPAWIALTVATGVFVICGMQMFVRLARTAALKSTATEE